MPNFKIPVAFLGFNRPDESDKVFAQIRKIKPAKLYLVTDGPRPDVEMDKKNCAKVRQILTEKIDWECEVVKNFAEKNMGCRDRISSGISWVFEREEMAIFIEDDCLPDLSFFYFAEELLNRYRDNERVYHISGLNPLTLFRDFDKNIFSESRKEIDYDFNGIPFIWGWASWARAWQKYDVNLTKFYQSDIAKIVKSNFKFAKSQDNWHDVARRLKAGEFGTWDYQWVFTCMMHTGLCAVPRVNLVKNIGFNEMGTHINEDDSIMSKLETDSISVANLRHPKTISRNEELHQDLQLKVFEGNSWKRRLTRKVCNALASRI